MRLVATWRRLPLIVRRLANVVPVLLIVSVVTFLLLSLLPGDPAIVILGENAQPETLAALRQELGLNEPIHVRYLQWLGDVLSGDLGRGYKTNQPVVEALRQRLPVTLELLVLSQLLSLGVAVPLGIASAYRAGSRLDRSVTVGTFTLIAIPNFVLALLLIFIFAVQVQVFPATGFVRLTHDLLGNLRSVVLPTIALSTGSMAVYTRMLRSEMLSTLQEDFVMVARAKGVPVRRVLFRHALRPSTFSLVTVIGLTIGNLVGGALVVEVIFGLPGVGRLLVDAIFAREYVVVQGVVGFIAVGYVLINFLVDAMYALLDPRVRHG